MTRPSTLPTKVPANLRIQNAILALQGEYRTFEIVDKVEAAIPGMLQFYQEPLKAVSTILNTLRKEGKVWSRAQPGTARTRVIWGIGLTEPKPKAFISEIFTPLQNPDAPEPEQDLPGFTNQDRARQARIEDMLVALLTNLGVDYPATQKNG